MADVDGDGDFDVISGHGQSPSLSVYYYEKQGERFAPPVLLGTLGSTTTPAGNWLMDMAAADVNRDGQMDVVVNGDNVFSWLLLRQGHLVLAPTTLVSTDFEVGVGPWGNPACSTGLARDTSTAATGAGSLRIFATGAGSCLTVYFVPGGWDVLQGPTLSFAYRIPPGTPVGFYLHVTNVGWVYVPGTATARSGPYAVLPLTPLVDDNAWHTASFDLYAGLRQRWPNAGAITAFHWGTDFNAPAGAQFWVDEVQVTGRRYVSGFQQVLLPSATGRGRGIDAADVDGDGDADLVRGQCCDGQLALYRGDGTGQFTPTPLAQSGDDPYGIALADFDRDGRVDLIANTGGADNPRFFKGLGSGAFQVGVPIPSLDTDTYAAYAAYDFNHDGHQDLAVAAWGTRQLWYYPGRGDGTFGMRLLIGTAAAPALGIAAPAGRAPGQPFGVLTVDHTTTAPGTPVTFDARNSYDDQALASYHWDFGDGTTVSGPVVAHAFATEGVYVAVLTVTDANGMQDRRSTVITAQGAPPVASAGGPYVIGETAARYGLWTATLDGRGSTDDAGLADFTWVMTRPPDNVQQIERVTGAVATATFPTPGVYQATLTVRDRTGQTSTDTTTVTVTAGAPPVAHAGGPYATAAGLPVAFSSQASGDDVALAQYRWEFGDGTVSIEAHPVHRYATPGTHTVTLTVTDHAAQRATATTTVATGRITHVDTTGVTNEAHLLTVAGTAGATLTNPDAAALGPMQVRFFVDLDGNGRFEATRDTLLGSTALDGLPAGTTAQVSAPVAGPVPFRDAPVMAFLDLGTADAAANPRNYASSAQACMFVPEAGAFAPVLKWQWTGGTAFLPATNKNVMMTPVVIDLNDDGASDVVFVTYIGVRDYFGRGYLRAISGADGRDLFVITDPAHSVLGAAGVAAGDLDGDGHPEIVAVAESQQHLLAFTADGRFLWRSALLPQPVLYGAPALADLDRDGSPEIVIGATVLRRDGTLRWSGTSGGKAGDLGPLAVVANLDLVGDPEVVAGNTAYRSDGRPYWSNPLAPAGAPAVGNFDTDVFPESALTASSQVALLEHTGEVRWKVAVPGGGGGPPLVADIDGNGVPEIGVAGCYLYTVFNANGSVRWSQPVFDPSCSTGSSAFDFDGDGTLEVVYGDERMLRIYRGTDGAVLWETPSPSDTLYEYPVLVDLDGDRHADIVKASNNHANAGIQVYSDVRRWVTTRRLWNQHAYHRGNVLDNGAIPPEEVPSWLTHNTFRRNLPEYGPALAFADLTAAFGRLDVEPVLPVLTVRLGNAGLAVAPTGTPVAFYDGDPRAGGRLLGTTATTQALAPGAFVDLTFPVSTATQATIWAAADDPGTQRGRVQECNEANNAFDTGLRARPNHPPVVSLGGPVTAREGTPLTLQATATDPDGDAITYAWDLNGDGAFSDAAGATPTVTFADNGTSPVAVRVSDGTVTVTATTTATVTNVTPVVASLGAEITIDVGTPWRHTGTFHDPGSDTWTAMVDYSDGTGVQPLPLASDHTFTLDHVYTTRGTYVVTVTVADDEGSGHATLFVTVRQPNRPPVANAGGPYGVAEGTPLTLDATHSTDPEGQPLTYAWDLNGDGTFNDASGPTPTATFPDNGTYQVAVQVSDGTLTHTATTTVTVSNVAPLVTLSSAPTVNVGTPLALTGTVADPGADTWIATADYGDGTGIQPLALAPDRTLSLAHTYTAPGVYSVTVTVADDDGGVGQATHAVTVVQPNRAPTAVASGPASAPEGTPVTLDGTTSRDVDGDGLTYQWVQTAGPAVLLNDATTARAVFTAPAVGQAGTTLIFTLTVNDGRAQTMATVTVSITDVNQPPVAHAGLSRTVDEGSLVTLDGTASLDPDGGPLTWAWSQVAGPTMPLSTATGATPTFTAPAVGPAGAILRFQLIVHDGRAASTPVEVTITVRDRPAPPVCTAAGAQPARLWPPNHRLVPVTINGVTAPQGQTLTLTVTGVTQDEPVNGPGDGNTNPDAVPQGASVLLRAERAGGGNGRVYRVAFRADTGSVHGQCTGVVTVCVPHSAQGACIGDSQQYDATRP